MAIIQVLHQKSQLKQSTFDESEQQQTGFDTHQEQGIQLHI